METSAKFHKEKGVHIRHFIISFYPRELSDPYVANEIAQQIICYLGNTHKAMYGVHEDEEHIHIHIAMNSVSYVEGSRYYGRKKEFYGPLNDIVKILKNYEIYMFYYTYK